MSIEIRELEGIHGFSSIPLFNSCNLYATTIQNGNSCTIIVISQGVVSTQLKISTTNTFANIAAPQIMANKFQKTRMFASQTFLSSYMYSNSIGSVRA